MPDPIKITDYAVNQSDRWLLIFTLTVCFLCVLALMKWFIKRLDDQTSLLVGLFNEANAGREKVAQVMGDSQLRIASVISDNTAHIQQCASIMEETTEFVRRVNDRLKVGKRGADID